MSTRAFRAQLSVSHRAMLEDGNDEAFRHILYQMVLASARLALFREAVGRLIGLTGNQLLATAHTQGSAGVTIRELSRYALMASTHVTTQVGALLRKDGRSVLVSLTPRGERAMHKIAPVRRKFNDAFFVGVERRTLLAAGRFLQQVVKNSEDALPLLG
jgi:DNA-binding MarR family transcriptional regulator